MKLPAYLAHELLRRLERDAPTKETYDLLAAIAISTDEPGPAPDFEAMEKRYDGACQTGSFILEGALDFLGYRAPLHFRISYAGPIDDDEPLDMLRGPSMQVDLLNWMDGEPAWVQVDTSILSESMVEDIWPAISLHASQAEASRLFND